MNKKGLGKGLGALITQANNDYKEIDNGFKEVSINEIEPNINQPRKAFDDEALIQLSESIKEHGIVQPIIVMKEEDIYRIIAGERRWRAARLAGLKKIPVIIREMTNKQVMEVALIENIQREDLNPVEEAEAYEKLLNEFGMTQEELSSSIGKGRSSIANSIRILTLNDKIKGYIINGDISSGHGRALLSLKSEIQQEEICNLIIEKKINVRDTEKLVKNLLNKKEGKDENKIQQDYEIGRVEEKIQNIFGTKVKIINKNKKGKIMIEYYSNDELDRIIELMNKISI
ncbi:UNVERIFIED_CONTAM: ParB family chromosome partitioning protein [Acetivibrio alkalicellulosi]